jgi:hypothetical protein
MLAVAVLAASCGSGGPGSTVAATPLPSYMATYPSGQPTAAYFLQWEQRGDAVDGTLTFVYPTAVDTPRQTEPVAGKVDGQKISLEVGTDAPQTWKGRRVGRTIVFEVEFANGSVQTLTFVPATLAAYRRTVAALRAQN